MKPASVVHVAEQPSPAATSPSSHHHSDARIKAAGMAIGYRFRITALRTNGQRAEVNVENIGIAPIAYDAFIAVDGVRSLTSLRSVLPGQRNTMRVAAGSATPMLSIACDRLVPGQVIGFDADLR